jgi:hypothetical protein
MDDKYIIDSFKHIEMNEESMRKRVKDEIEKEPTGQKELRIGKRNVRKLIVLIAAVIVVLAFGVALAQDNDYKVNQANLIKEAKIIASMPGIFTDQTKIGEVEGIPVYKEELELIAAHWKSLGKENPYKDAMEHLKKYKHNEKLTIQYGITVSDKEISAYIDRQRDLFDDPSNDPEMTRFLKDYYAALQMTEDEYWTIYEPIFAKRLYYKSKVNAYMKAHGIEDISSDDIEYTINDAEYRDKIEGK